MYVDLCPLPRVGLYARGAMKCERPFAQIEEAKALAIFIGGVDLESDKIGRAHV